MYCDKCVVEMEIGYFHTSLWRPGVVPTWVKKNMQKRMQRENEKFCNAWKCPSCNRIEFFCEE